MKQFLQQHLISLLMGVVVIALAIGFYLRLQEESAGAGGGGGAAGSAVPVVVTEVTVARFADSLQAVGSTRANESIELTANVSDRIDRILFREGQQVETGQLLVEMNAAEARAELAEAEVLLQDHRRQLDRLDRLVATNSAAQSQRDEQQARTDAAVARVEALRARVADREIRAPFAGRLGLREVSPGAHISAGTMITTLDDIQPIKLDFSVPEGFLATLREGAALRARTAAWPDETFAGEVVQISPRVDPVSRAVTIRAEIANDELRLRPGMLMLVDLIRAERDGLMVPESALNPRGDRQFVFRLDGDRAEEVEVQVGARRPGMAEILSGLQQGDRIVIEGGMRLRPGREVRVRDEVEAVGWVESRLPRHSRSGNSHSGSNGAAAAAASGGAAGPAGSAEADG